MLINPVTGTSNSTIHKYNFSGIIQSHKLLFQHVKYCKYSMHNLYSNHKRFLFKVINRCISWYLLAKKHYQKVLNSVLSIAEMHKIIVLNSCIEKFGMCFTININNMSSYCALLLGLHLVLIFPPLYPLLLFLIIIPDAQNHIKWGFEYFWVYIFTTIWCTCFSSRFQWNLIWPGSRSWLALARNVQGAWRTDFLKLAVPQHCHSSLSLRTVINQPPPLQQAVG